MSKKFLSRLFGLALILFAGSMLAESASASSSSVCPLIVAPVICSNGHVYVNLCFANKAHATGCVPFNLAN